MNERDHFFYFQNELANKSFLAARKKYPLTNN